jgi:tetratricopeptide (TPR) repeat protein
MSERLDRVRAQISALEAEQRLRELAPVLREAAALAAFEEGPESSAYVAALNEQGSLLRTLKELDESEAVFRKAAEIELRARGKTADYATCINNLAGTYRLLGDFQTAEHLFMDAMEIYEDEVGTEHFVYLSALNNLGLVYQDLKRYDEAEHLHRQALAVLEKSGEQTTAFATTLNNLASVAMATGRYGEAENFLERTLAIYEETAGKGSVLYLTGLNNLGAACYTAGDYGRAAERFQEALYLIERVLGQGHPDYARTGKNLSRTLEKLREDEGGERQPPAPE